MKNLHHGSKPLLTLGFKNHFLIGAYLGPSIHMMNN